MPQATVIVGTPQSGAFVDGAASTLRRFEQGATRLARGAARSSGEPTGAAAHRPLTLQRALARTLQAAHLETVQELTSGEGG